MQRKPNSHYEDTAYSQSRANTLRGSLLAVMNIEIRPGLKDKIFIHQLDNDHDLAQTFIDKHSLPSKALPILIKQIRSNKLAVKQSASPHPPESTPMSTYSKEGDHSEQYTARKDTSQMANSRYSRNSNAKPSPMIRSRSTTDVTNRLYNENLMKTKYLAELEQKALEKMERMQSQMGTHQPQINRISMALASDRKRQKPIEDHLNQLGVKLSHRRQVAASLQARKQVQQCSFKPALNRVTTKLTKDRPEPTFSKCLQKQTQQSYDNLFKPALNRMSRQIMRDKGCFLTRQKHYQQQRQSKINRLHQNKRKNQAFDQATGQPLFNPHTYSKPKVWNQNNLDVGQYLYEKGRMRQEYDVQEQKPCINRHSQQLVKNLHAKRIIWIFGELDSDQDGLVSSQSINIETIPDPVLQIIMPILFEMEQFNFQLNLQQFKQALETLHKSLTAAQKSVLYDYRRRKNDMFR